MGNSCQQWIDSHYISMSESPEKPKESETAMWLGCSGFFAVVAACLIFPGQLNLKGWLATYTTPAPPVGRYQIVTGRSPVYDSAAKEQPAIIKLDTATGKTWVFLPFEFGNSTNGEFYFQPNRWIEADDHWTAKQAAKDGPKK